MWKGRCCVSHAVDVMVVKMKRSKEKIRETETWMVMRVMFVKIICVKDKRK